MAIVSKSTEKILLGAGVLFIVATFITGRKVINVISDNAHLVNPINDNNIINQGVSKIVSDSTGGKSKNLGGYIYCLINSRSLICNSKRAALASVYDVDKLSDEQVDQLYDQQQDFLTNSDFVKPS